MKLHKTAQALVARGLSTDVAVKLSNQGYTLTKLKQTDASELLKLGLKEDFIKNLHSEQRPPINAKVLNEILYESRFCCCVCRDNTKPVVVHHITPWEQCHSHHKENLVILCQQHHDEAHTKHGLTLSLTPERLRSIKENWLAQVAATDSLTIQSLAGADFACWDYFNLTRIIELSRYFNISYQKIRTYEYLLKLGYIDNDGYIIPVEKWQHKPKSYWLDMMHGVYISYYLRDTFVNMLSAMPIKILNYIWSKSNIVAQCKAGDFVFLQGAFYFKDIKVGKKTLRKAYRQARGIKLEFLFDPWYCTSSSSKFCHLTGRRVATVFAIIREIVKDEEEDLLIIRCSSLAIGSFFNDIYDGRFFIDNSVYDEFDDYDYYNEYS